ncbi:MmpS family transport accessory protein [Actinoplanes sp. NPDC051861]|uniref:MmpS family transport accessory protein n=1 Tax=Actinoplanes sp. NPDC051861 TaxID=3155170 RepID=UPI0034239DE2
MSEPMPPRPPEFKPGQATPQPYEPAPEYPPTSQFPPVNYAPPGYEPDYGEGGYPPPGYPPPHYPEQPGYPGYPPSPPPRRSNKPLIAVIIAVSVLLCGGVVTSGVLLVQRATDKAEQVVAPILDPTLPAFPTDAPEIPLPSDLPEFPTDLPDLPNLGEGRKITVTYEVTGDGPARILYTEQLGKTPKVIENVDLPWKATTTMEGAALVSVTAQRMNPDEGSITCRATVDGEKADEKTAEGALATTTCNKLVFN